MTEKAAPSSRAAERPLASSRRFSVSSVWRRRCAFPRRSNALSCLPPCELPACLRAWLPASRRSEGASTAPRRFPPPAQALVSGRFLGSGGEGFSVRTSSGNPAFDDFTLRVGRLVAPTTMALESVTLTMSLVYLQETATHTRATNERHSPITAIKRATMSSAPAWDVPVPVAGDPVPSRPRKTDITGRF